MSAPVTTLPDLNKLPLPELYLELARTGLVRRALELARDEDLGTAGLPHGDITSEAALAPDARASGRIVARQAGVIAGLAALPDVMRVFAPDASLELVSHDGARAARGDVLACLSGPARQLLAAERTTLNLVGRLSGVATLTARYAESGAPGTRARVCDTRKTSPGLRVLEKYAVRCGGGWCHRVGLNDAMLLKDNHLAHVPLAEFGAFVAACARRGRVLRPQGLRFIEVEVDRLEQFEMLLAPLPDEPDIRAADLIDIVLLDNMPIEQLKEAVRRRDARAPRLLLEASGGVTFETLGAIAATGVDRISVGALTHSAAALDVALDFDAAPPAGAHA